MNIALVNLLLLIGLTGDVPQSLPARSVWEGRLVIGGSVYAVKGEHEVKMRGEFRLAMDILGQDGSPVRSLLAEGGVDAASLMLDGKAHPVPPAVATAWHQQLRTLLRGELSSMEYSCSTEAGGRVCDSREQIRLDDSLSGRLRLLYNAAGDLSGVRFFSLAEWSNPFGAYVSLSLEFHERRR